MKTKLYLYLLLVFLSIPIAHAYIAQETNSTWAGYSIYDLYPNHHDLYVVNAINGSWIVQNAISTSQWTYGSQWIGIGGIGSEYTPLLQIGTVSDWFGMPVYFSFYELAPLGSAPTPIPMTIKPNDTIYASISLVNRTYCFPPSLFQCWKLFLNDTSENQIPLINPFTTYVSYYQNTTSADWEDESLQNLLTGSPYPLIKFRAAYFGPYYTNIEKSDYANVNLTDNSIGAFPQLTEFHFGSSNSTGFANPSNLTDGGTSFIVYEGPQLEMVGGPQCFKINAGSGTGDCH